MSALLAALAPWWPWVLGALALVVLVVVLRIAYLVLSRTAPEEGAPQPAEDGETAGAPDAFFDSDEAEASALGVRLAARRAFRQIRAYAPRATARYADPWILMIGPSGAGKDRVLSGLQLPRPLPELARGAPAWHVFDQGVVIDAPGAFVRRSDGSADTRGWDALLQSLVHHRPDRPVDGIVVSIPAAVLWGRGARVDVLRQLGEAFYDRLRQAQSALALRLPVHVLVTGMEAVPGFGDFAEQLPERARSDVFGWSTPYSLETAFHDGWVGEAFRDVYQRLARTCVEMLASRTAVPDPAALFRFPERFRSLEDPLRSLLASVFRESAYHESFFLRGIYFSGTPAREGILARSGLEPAGEEGAHPDLHEDPQGAGPARTLFVDALFQRKIFPERGLATAFRAGVLDRNRRIRALQIASLLVVLIGVPGMLWAHGRLADAGVTTQEVLTQLEVEMGDLDRMRASGGSMSADVLEGEVFELLESMAALDVGRFGSVFLPTSLFSEVDEEIEATLESGFSQVVFPVLRLGIVHWADTLQDGTWARVKAASEVETGVVGLGAGSLPEHYALTRYLGEVAGYGPAVELFNQITAAEEGSIDQFADLVEWYFEEELPPSFRERPGFYDGSLRAARGTPIAPDAIPGFQEGTSVVAAELVEAIYDEFFRRVEAVEAAVSTIASGTASYGEPELRALRADLAGVERFLGSAEVGWLHSEVSPDSAVQALLEEMTQTPVLDGPAWVTRFGAEVGRIRAARLAELRARLPALRGVVTADATLGDETSGMPALAPGLVQLQASLDGLLAMGFMAPPPGRPQPIVPAFGARPTWDARPLDEAVALFEDMQRFRAEGLAGFPPTLQGPVGEVARRALESRVREAVTAAMTFDVVPDATGRAALERDLTARIRSFDEAARRLVRMMELDEATGGFQVSEVLAEVVALEVLDLLQVADEIMEVAPPYALAGGTLGNWQGGRPAAWAAFGVQDAAALEARLAQQRESLRAVAQLVATPLGYTTLPPVARLLAGADDLLGPGAAARLARWRGILRTLDQYQAQTPGNALAAMEAFVRGDMAATGPAACPRQAVGASPPAGDYFAVQQEQLARAFQQRCGELARAEVEVAYARLRAHFSEQLVGRFPFVTGDAALTAPDADPAAVRRLLTLYDETVAPLGEDAPAVFATLPGGQEAAAFVRRLGELRPLLQLALGAAAGQAPRLGYRVDFRTDRSYERGADQIAEWALTVGGRRSTYGDPEDRRTGTWSPAEPVSLTLRWATGSLQRPVSQGDPAATFDGPSVTWTHGGPWSLLRLLEVHRPPAEVVLEDVFAEPGTLRFAVATAAAETRALETGQGSGPESLAVAFLRLRLHDPATGALLATPPFPTAAPVLTAAAATGGR